jgi:signal peptidase I
MTDAEMESAAVQAPVETDPPTESDTGPTGHVVLTSLWELLQTIILAVALFFLIRNFIQNYRIDGVSMEPNFHHGQFLIVNRFAYCPGLHFELPPVGINFDKTWCIRLPRRGDVIVFEYPRDPSRDFIKRVIALPGETVETREGRVYVNGQLVPETFGPNPGSYNSGPLTLGADELYVLGDNRNNSSDSHAWGTLPMHYVIGKALVSYWPPRYWSVVPHYDLTDLSAAQSP